MTNQDVVVPDMGIAATAAMAGSAPAAPLLACRGVAAGSMSLRRQAYLDLAAAAASRAANNPWVEAMRASSPTRPRDAIDDEFAAWLRKHPSALDKFDQIVGASKGKDMVVFLDYDGTLSPIVADPESAYISDAMRAAVRGVAKHFPTAIISGRCRAKVYKFVGLSELYYAGSHGMDIRGPSSNAKTVLCQPASEFLPMIDEAYKALVEETKSTPGAKVENNKFCLSVHFRRVDEKRWGALVEQVKLVLEGYPNLALTQGRKVLEIRPSIMWDKGKAVEFLLESLGFADCSHVLPVYIGDDRTDEDAFKVLRKRDQGLGILVSKCPRETSASYSLQDPTEVMNFLVRLVEWKRRSRANDTAKGRNKKETYSKRRDQSLELDGFCSVEL